MKEILSSWALWPGTVETFWRGLACGSILVPQHGNSMIPYFVDLDLDFFY